MYLFLGREGLKEEKFREDKQSAPGYELNENTLDSESRLTGY